MQTQNSQILKYLRRFPRKGISPAEAVAVFRIFRLAARVHELRQSGHRIETSLRKDVTGKTFARYRLAH